MESDPIIEAGDEVEELIIERLQGIVKEHLGKFSEDGLSSLIKRVIAREGMRVSVTPTFNVPKGEPPIAQFSLPPMEPHFAVPEPKVVITESSNTALLQSIAFSLDRLKELLQMPRRMTVERDANGHIKSIVIDRIQPTR